MQEHLHPIFFIHLVRLNCEEAAYKPSQAHFDRKKKLLGNPMCSACVQQEQKQQIHSSKARGKVDNLSLGISYLSLSRHVCLHASEM